MRLFLVGAGHVGLVTAVGLAKLGHELVVSDVDAARIERLRAGEPPIFEPGLREALIELGSRVTFTTDPLPPAGVTCSFVIVNTPTDATGPLSIRNVRAAVGGLLAATDATHTIVVRSTLPLHGPAALAELRGGRADQASIVTNPEFMREGSALRDFEQPGRLVAGWVEPRDEPAARAVLDLYAGIDSERLVADAGSVALIKLASNVFLAMKIGYANELARLSEAIGADVRAVADGIGLDPRIGRAFLDAGPGFGGSCLPEQSTALAVESVRAAIEAPLIAAVERSNATHQGAIVERLARLLGRPLGDSRIAVLGLAFKANTDDVRESPALAIVERLRSAGASVVATDPRAVRRARLADPALEIAVDPEAAASGADAIVIATEWPDYRSLDWSPIATAMRGDLVFDTRSVADPAAVAAAGLRLVVLGRPDDRFSGAAERTPLAAGQPAS
ncbi:MAG TPA: nucleotide sugar dehydrogenase [Candidatus Limnocylindrales bacterium]|nr:nucleotide sugar dehydrogenase [Candidatus Limnocylindrales bacterium]